MKSTVILFLLFLVPFVCTSCTCRNGIETVWIENSSDVLDEENLNVALELRHERKVIPFKQYQEFLKSDESLNLTDEIRQIIESKTAKVIATLPRAEKLKNQDMILLRPDPDKPFSTDNLVLYIKSKTDFNTFFSIEEIDQYIIQHWVKMDDDLEQITFLDYVYRAETLERLSKKLHALNFILPSFPRINQEDVKSRWENWPWQSFRPESNYNNSLENIKIDKAADLLLRTLRALKHKNIKLRGPIIKRNGPGGRTISPKLITAFKDKGVRELIENSSDSNVRNAFKYLLDKGVIEINS